MVSAEDFGTIDEQLDRVVRGQGVDVTVEARDMQAAFDAIEARGLVILGFDAFERHSDGIMPRLDRIADFSSIYRDPDAVERGARAAAEIVAGWGADFDFAEISVTRRPAQP